MKKLFKLLSFATLLLTLSAATAMKIDDLRVAYKNARAQLDKGNLSGADRRRYQQQLDNAKRAIEAQGEELEEQGPTGGVTPPPLPPRPGNGGAARGKNLSKLAQEIRQLRQQIVLMIDDEQDDDLKLELQDAVAAPV